MTRTNRKPTNNGSIDWKVVYASFKTVLERERLGDRLSTLTLPLLLVLVGLLLISLEVNDTALGFFIAALIALLWTRRRMAKCEAQDPFVVTGLLTNKGKPSRSMGRHGYHDLTIKVRTAHYIHARGKGDECPELLGVKRINAPEVIVQQLKPQSVVSLVCLPSGEARGLIKEGRIFIPPHGGENRPRD